MRMSERIPTTEEVRYAYGYAMEGVNPQPWTKSEEAFDRWLAARDREKRADALRQYHERREAGQSHYAILRDMGALVEQEGAE